MNQSCDDDDRSFHNVKTGEEIKGYKFIKPLGRGVHGSVFSAFDTRDNSLVAIKISRGTPGERDGIRQEIWMQHYLLTQAQVRVAGCMAMLKGEFEFGGHICLVFDILGKSLAQFLSENTFRPFPRHHVQEITRQLLAGVAFLHDNNVIHTDLKPDNILLVHDAYDEIAVTKNENEDTHNLPYGTAFARVTDKPWRILREAAIRIIDFGLAVYNTPGRVYYHRIQALDYRAPEVSLELSWTFSVDVYALGFIFSELRSGLGLFTSEDDFQRLCALQAFIGPMPQDLASEGAKMYPGYFTEQDGKLEIAWRKRFDEVDYQFLVERRRTFDCIVDGRSSDKTFKRLLEVMLDYDPVRRITAQDALDHEYFHLDVPFKRSTL